MSVTDLLLLRHIGGYSGNFSISPDGQLLAFQLQQADFSARTYRIDWWVVPVEGDRPPRRVGGGGELILSSGTLGRTQGARAEIKAQWSPDGRWIAYLRKDSGQAQLWRSRPDGSRHEQLTHNAADVTAFKWKPDGTAIYFIVGRNREQVRRIDLLEGDRGYVLDDRFLPEYSLKPLWFPCDADVWAVAPPSSQPCKARIGVVDFAAGERRANAEEEREFKALLESPIPGQLDARREIRGIAQNDDGRLAWLENEDLESRPGLTAPLTLFVDGRRCEEPECRGQLKSVYWSGESILFIRNEGHSNSIPAVYALRPDGGVRLLYRLDSALGPCEIAHAQLVCLQETPGIQRRIVSIDAERGGVRPIFDPNKNICALELGVVERLEWQDGFGNDTFGHLVYPPGYQRGRRYPLVIVQYVSRGFLNGGVGEEYPIYPMAAAGFLVLSFDRPSDRDLWMKCRYGLTEMIPCEAKEWEDGYRQRRKLQALELIVEKLVERGIVDADRIGITGLSDGAETVEFALFNSMRFAAGAHSGHWSPASYDLAVNESARNFFRGFLGARVRKEALEKWGALSLRDNAERVAAPLLVQVSDKELLMSVPNLVALKDAHKMVDAYVYPDEYHIKWQPQHKWAVGERAIEWFKFWLKGECSADPMKFEWCARWRAMIGDAIEADKNLGF